MVPIYTVAAFLWLAIGIMLLEQWVSPIKSLPASLKIFVFLLVMITAPFLLIADIVTTFLDIVFPPGWQDGDDQKPRF